MSSNDADPHDELSSAVYFECDNPECDNPEGHVMKSFWCGAVIPNCDSSFEAETEDDILDRVAEHAAAHHGFDQVPPEIVARVRESIVDK